MSGVVNFLLERTIFLKNYKNTMFDNPRWREQPQYVQYYKCITYIIYYIISYILF